jgi:aminoglycoside 6'-N-acetyltransferase I
MRLTFWPDSGDDDLAAILEQSLDPAVGVAIFVGARATGGLCGFAEFGERPYAEGCLASPAAYFEGWWVDEDARRSGVGAALFAAGADWARARGRREIASDALIDNAVSIAAHGALGFHEVERIVCFRRDL